MNYSVIFLTAILIFCGNYAMEKEKSPAQQLNIRFVNEGTKELIIVLNNAGMLSEKIGTDFSREKITTGGKIVTDLKIMSDFFAHGKNTRIPLFTVAVADESKWKRGGNLTLDLFFPENNSPHLRLSVGGHPLGATSKNLAAIKNKEIIDVKIVLKDNLRDSILTVE